MQKIEIINASKEVFNRFSDTCQQIPDRLFFSQPTNKWSIAGNADHLVRSVRHTNLAYSLPKLILRIAFGQPRQHTLTYEDLVARYKLKLAQGGKASGRYLPKINSENKFSLLQKWQKENEKYLELLELKWTERQLDQYVAPHPLLGKITLRELCYFTIYHTEHHLEIVKKRLTE
jgi:hypothetical protein